MNNIAPTPQSKAVQQFSSDLVNQINNASFVNAILLPKQQDLMDPEKVEDNSYLFDTTAYAGKVATLIVNGVELIAAYVQVVRLTTSCSQDTLNSMVLDDQCFNDLADNKEWIVLANTLQPQPHSNAYSLNHSNVYELNNQSWVEAELLIHPPLNELLDDLTAYITFVDETDITELLEHMQHTIFEKCKHELQDNIPTLE